MHTFLLTVHVFLAITMIGLILIQHGKGADAGAAFGGGGSAGSLFGARGSASFLTRATAILATLFFLNSLTLAYLTGQRTSEKGLIESLSPAPVVQEQQLQQQQKQDKASSLPLEQQQPKENAISDQIPD